MATVLSYEAEDEIYIDTSFTVFFTKKIEQYFDLSVQQGEGASESRRHITGAIQRFIQPTHAGNAIVVA